MDPLQKFPKAIVGVHIGIAKELIVPVHQETRNKGEQLAPLSPRYRQIYSSKGRITHPSQFLKEDLERPKSMGYVDVV